MCTPVDRQDEPLVATSLCPAVAGLLDVTLQIMQDSEHCRLHCRTAARFLLPALHSLVLKRPRGQIKTVPREFDLQLDKIYIEERGNTVSFKYYKNQKIYVIINRLFLMHTKIRQ